jgi:hypothetical protein
MSKLRLRLDELDVDTFDVDAGPAPARGTVNAHGGQETIKIVCQVSTLKTDLTCCPCTPMI